MLEENKNTIIFLGAIPILGSLYLTASHFYSDLYLADRFLPIIIGVGLIIYLTKQHYSYWDKSIIHSEYISRLNIFISIAYSILLTIVLVQIDLNDWYKDFVLQKAIIFYHLPFIFSAYVVPFLLFSHVLADSNDDIKRLKYTASAYLLIIVCFAFWFIKQSSLIPFLLE